MYLTRRRHRYCSDVSQARSASVSSCRSLSSARATFFATSTRPGWRKVVHAPASLSSKTSAPESASPPCCIPAARHDPSQPAQAAACRLAASPGWIAGNGPIAAVTLRPSFIGCDAQSLHRAHHRHRTPRVTAMRRDLTIGQFLRDLAIWQLPHGL
jgi:hypothetical protein